MEYCQNKIINKLNEYVADAYHDDVSLVNQVIAALKLGKIRVSKIEDHYPSIDDLAGDCFDPNINNDIEPSVLKKQKRNFVARVNRNGVWGAAAEVWNGREWIDNSVECNAIFGFVGDDFIGSGYELELLSQALEGYESQVLDHDGFVIDPYRLAA